jgi:hypothetical protein
MTATFPASLFTIHLLGDARYHQVPKNQRRAKFVRTRLYPKPISTAADLNECVIANALIDQSNRLS